MPSTLAALVGYSIAFRGDWYQTSHKIKAGETFKVDELVYLDSNGELVAAAAAGNAVGAIKPAGFAKGNATPLLAAYGSGAECPVSRPGYDAQFTLPVSHTTVASAVIARNETDAPITLPLLVSSTGVLCADKENNGTNDLVVWMDRDPAYDFGETFGVHWWSFKDGVTLREGS